jgi:UDP-N-acetylglucosamine 2-epimerase (non-hydrolysing)
VTDLFIAVGEKPDLLRAASIVRAARSAGLTSALIHTSQHCDRDLAQLLFEDLELTPPDVILALGSASSAAQAAVVMLAFEAELRRVNPSVVVVVGDADSTLACALVAIREGFRVAHVNAGLRSPDRSSPEQVNRRLCDQLATYLFTPSRDADDNLLREGVPAERIEFVGNTLSDTLRDVRRVARARSAAHRAAVDAGPEGYVVVALEPSGPWDDEADGLSRVIEAVLLLSRCARVVFPLSAPLRERLAFSRAEAALAAEPGVTISDPLGYLEYVGLLAGARLVITASGVTQEETTVLGVPCLTLGDHTDRAVTVSSGTNRVIGLEPASIVDTALDILEQDRAPAPVPELWDGHAGERVVEHLRAALYGQMRAVAAGP